MVGKVLSSRFFFFLIIVLVLALPVICLPGVFNSFYLLEGILWDAFGQLTDFYTGMH